MVMVLLLFSYSDEASRLEQSQLITRSMPVVELLPHLKKQCPDGLFDLLREQSGICDQVFGNYSCTLVKNLWVEMCEHGDLTTLMTITFPTFVTQLSQEAERWISLSISCEKAVSSLPPQAEQKELRGMIDVLKACNFAVEETPNWMPMVIHKVKLYRDIRNQLTAAELLLKAKTSLGLDGDFTALKSVVQVKLSNSFLSKCSKLFTVCYIIKCIYFVFHEYSLLQDAMKV